MTWKRVLAIAAGPAMNVRVAFVLFAVYATEALSRSPSAEVAQVQARTPTAAAAGPLGLISMSLALFNLLPLLPLDGGNLLIALVEGVRRRPVPRVSYQRFSMVGTALILLVTVIAFSNDMGARRL